jgi:hypothetical protein
MLNIIYKWVLSLIKGEPNKQLFSKEFQIEDGMSLEEYIEYEKYQFDTLSHIYDLNENFFIKEYFKYTIKEKTIVYFYILNKFKKIVCKMSLTIENETCLLTSNNSMVQAVPKFTIEDNQITQIGLAIKSKHSLKKVFCDEYDLISFYKGDNYKNDLFYTAKFEGNKSIQHKLLFFTFVMKSNKVIIERKPVFFDIFLPELKPFKIKDNQLIIIDEKYPVHLSIWSVIGKNENYEYPRNLSISLKDKICFTITDSIDNDWIVKI